MATRQETSLLSPEEHRLSTEHRLLLAAERLFAAKGVGAVSLRSVMAAAQANTAAVHYHFGSKEGLVAAMLRERTEAMRHRRLELLGEIRRRGAPTARDLAEVVVRPISDTAAEGGADYLRVLGELLGRRDAAQGLQAAFDLQEADWDALYDEAVPGLDPAVRAFRVGQGVALAVRVLGEADGYAAWLAERGGPVGRRVPYDLVLDAVMGLLSGVQSID